MEHKTSSKNKLIVLILLPVIIISAGCLFYLNSDGYHYRKALKLLEQNHYEEALAILEDIGEYKDSTELAKQASYEIGYSLYQQDDFLKAADYFEKAQDYKYAEDFLNTCWYQLGHQAFLKDDFEVSRSFFSNIDNILDYGLYHFETYDEAKEYIIEESLKASGTIELYMADTGPESEYGMEVKLTYLASAEQAYVDWDSSEKKVSITPVYYPGVKLVAYHRQNRISQFTQKETGLYEKALKIVEQARAETSGIIELEAWLNRWLSTNVIYTAESLDNYSDFLLPREWTAFGAIMDGKANCQGFADAFYLLASLADFNVRYQFGIGADGGHVWNAIELDGQWYYIDTTWNNMDDSFIDVSYACFNYAEGEILDQKPYEFAKTIDTAKKTNVKFDYYSLHNAVFDSLQEASRYAINQRLKEGQKTVHLKISSLSLDNDDLIKALKKQLTNYGYSVYVSSYRRKLDTCFTVYWDYLYN